MSTLLTTYSITTIVLILIVAVPAIFKFVKWVIDIVKKHKSNQQEAFDQGYEAAQEDEEVEERFEAGEEFMRRLDEREDRLETLLANQQKMIENQQTQINYLADSDNLKIKADVYETWLRVVKERKPIDAYELSLLNDRYAIYEARGGNSWAHDQMQEIRKYAVTASAENIGQDK